MIIDSKSRLRPAPAQMSMIGDVPDEADCGASIYRRAKAAEVERVGKCDRFRGALAALHRAGEIDDAHVGAADRWAADYIFGVMGARDPERKSSGKAPDLHAQMLSRSAAVARCRLVRSSLGFCSEVRLKMLLVEELSFSAMAEKLLPGDGNGRKKIAAQATLLLEQLTEFYFHYDRQRKTIAD
jgi:hypothetical protein